MPAQIAENRKDVRVVLKRILTSVLTSSLREHIQQNKHCQMCAAPLFYQYEETVGEPNGRPIESVESHIKPMNPLPTGHRVA